MSTIWTCKWCGKSFPASELHICPKAPKDVLAKDAPTTEPSNKGKTDG